MNILKRIKDDQMGATAIEYGLIAALIAVASIVALKGTGSELSRTFNKTSSTMAATNA